MSLAGNIASRNANRDAWVAEFPAGSLMQFYNGSVPAVDSAVTGTKIADITLPASPWDTATNGAAIKQGTWSTTTTLAGTPTYARLVNAAGTRVRQFVVGTDITASAVATNGDAYILNTYTVSFA